MRSALAGLVLSDGYDGQSVPDSTPSSSNLGHALACRQLSSPCVFPLTCLFAHISPFYKNAIPIGLGSTLVASSYLDRLQGPVSK